MSLRGWDCLNQVDTGNKSMRCGELPNKPEMADVMLIFKASKDKDPRN